MSANYFDSVDMQGEFHPEPSYLQQTEFEKACERNALDCEWENRVEYTRVVDTDLAELAAARVKPERTGEVLIVLNRKARRITVKLEDGSKKSSYYEESSLMQIAAKRIRAHFAKQGRTTRTWIPA